MISLLSQSQTNLASSSSRSDAPQAADGGWGTGPKSGAGGDGWGTGAQGGDQGGESAPAGDTWGQDGGQGENQVSCGLLQIAAQLQHAQGAGNPQGHVHLT